MVLRATDVATGVSFVPIVPLRKKRREPLSDHKENKTWTKMTATDKLHLLVNDDLSNLLQNAPIHPNGGNY